MNALREVFARFDFRFNQASLTRVSAGIDGMIGRARAAVTSFRAIGAAIAGLAVVQVIRRWIGAIREFVDDIRAMGDEIGKTSKVIGISVENLQAWRFAAGQSGVAAEAFSMSLVRLQRNALEAQRGSVSMEEAFARLGVSVEDSNGQLRSAEEILLDMAEPLKNLQSDTERVAILNTIMGRSGARMGPLFLQGAEGIEALLAQFQELGGGLSQDVIDQSEELTDRYGELDVAILSLKSSIAFEILPALIEGIRTFTGWAAALKRADERTGIISKTMEGLKFALLVVAATFLPLLALVAAVVISYALLHLAIEEVISLFKGQDSILNRGIKTLGRWINQNEIVETVTGWWRDFLGVLNEVLSVLDKIGSLLLGPLGAFLGEDAGRSAIAGPLAALVPDAEGNASPTAQAFGIELEDVLGVFGGVPAAAAARVLNQETTVNIQGAGLSEQEAQRAIDRTLDRRNREALDALGQE